jgi:Rod binding domain-containing protein
MSVANTIPARQALEAYAAAAKAKPGSREAKALNAAQGFEATFLQNMLDNLVSGVGEEGPLGGSKSGPWRGFLTDEMARSMTKTSSIGIAPQVYREMMRLQEKAA